jgi:hypothetical protein
LGEDLHFGWLFLTFLGLGMLQLVANLVNDYEVSYSGFLFFNVTILFFAQSPQDIFA